MSCARTKCSDADEARPCNPSVSSKALYNQGWDKNCSDGKFLRKMPAWQLLQKSLKWQILAFMTKIVLKPCKIKNLLLYFAKKLESIA